MDVGITHIETWAVSITPGEGEEWPLIPAGGRYQMRPDLILIQVMPGQPTVISGSGRRNRRDGTPGALRVNAPWRGLAGLPDWAAEMVSIALQQLPAAQAPAEAGPGHMVIPLPGSVRSYDGMNRDNGYDHVPSSWYPLSGLCSECHQPATRTHPETDWAHCTDAGAKG
jgi:hypothetical protein